jgi:hypothetical protein
MLRSTAAVSFIGMLLGLPFLAGCAGGPEVSREGPAAEAPAYRVGDRWVYKAQDGFRLPVVWEEVHEVTAIGTGGITVRVTQRGPNVDTDRTEVWAAPGVVLKGAVFDAETRDFRTPLVRYPFPLKPGETTRAQIDNFNQSTGKAGQFSRWVTVDGWGQVTTPAGTYDALRLKVRMQLDDDEFWRGSTECSHDLWYAPSVRATVREEKEGAYYERSAGPRSMPIRSQHALVELVSFTPGAR